MTEHFKLWSESNPSKVESIQPQLGLRDWSFLEPKEKQNILQIFNNKKWFQFVFPAIKILNDSYKRMTYGKEVLNHGGPHFVTLMGTPTYNTCCVIAALKDFNNIFLKENQNVVYEMLSVYADSLINKHFLKSIKTDNPALTNDDYKKKAYKDFDLFTTDFNDIFEQYSLDVMITRSGIIFRQDSRITDEIYVPVLTYLANKKWIVVNREISDAFKKFQDKTPQGYSSAITLIISALQGFLQILVSNKIGKGEIDQLIERAIKNNLIPNDSFSKNIFKGINSILMEIRQKSGDPHPKKEYANEKTAILVMNLFMVFIQHALTHERED